MKLLVKIFGNIFFFFFGSFKWRLPPWLALIKSFFLNVGTWVRGHYSKNSKAFFFQCFLLLGLFLGGAFGIKKYMDRPKPIEISLSASDISPTKLDGKTSPDKFYVNFEGSVAKISNIGKGVQSGITLFPKIEGRWKWKSDRSLEFTVKDEWPASEDFEVKFSKKLFPKHVLLEAYKVQGRTPKFSAQIENKEFYQNPVQAKEKKAIFTVKFTHPVDKTSFEKSISLSLVQGGEGRLESRNELSAKVTYDKYLGVAYIQSENISIPDYKSKVQLKISDDVKNLRENKKIGNDLSGEVEIPGVFDYFKFSQVALKVVQNKKYESEQVVVFDSTVRIDGKSLNENVKVYLLPRSKADKYKPNKMIYNPVWDFSEVTDSILKKSERLKLTHIPNSNQYSSLNSFRFKADPGRFLYIQVLEGLSSFGGYKLPELKTFVKKVPSFPREIKIMAEGSILSLSGEKKVSILARDIENIRFRARRILPGQLPHLITQSYSSLPTVDFRDPYYFNMDNISETFDSFQELNIVEQGQPQYSHFDFTALINKKANGARGVFQFSAGELKGKPGKSNSIGVEDHRLILLTDLGLVSKKSADGSYSIFVQSILSGLPVSNVKIEMMGKNGLSVFTGTTAANGVVEIPSLSDLENEKEPIAIIAQKQKDYSFLILKSSGPLVNYSRFDVGGDRSRGEEAALESYLFTDRGIYRPGEEVRIGYVLKSSDWSQNMANLKLEIEIIDPKGARLLKSRPKKLSAEGLNEFIFKTKPNYQTGSYTVNFYRKFKKNRRKYVGSVGVKIEEFVPDKMKISTKFSVNKSKGWIHPDKLAGLVTLTNLFGTPAQYKKIKAKMTLTPAFMGFSKYKDWIFYDPLRSKETYSQELATQETNEKGEAQFDLALTNYETASYNLKFIAEGFEDGGGRSVLASSSAMVSPLDYLIAFKAEGELNYLKRNSAMKVNFIAINSDLKKVKSENLKIKLVEYKFISTLVKQSNGTYKYQSVKKDFEKSQSNFSIGEKGQAYTIDTKTPGSFALIIEDSDKRELNKVAYTVVGNENLTFNLEKNSELQVRTNKKDYKPGETIEVEIKSPFVGAGLITIEKEKIYTFKWFKTTTTSSIHEIEVPADLEGNGYINVFLTRSLGSDDIFMSPLSVGVSGFSVDRSSRTNLVDIKVPERVRPGESLEIGVKASHSGKAIVFAVDEGILRVSRYEAPDPLKTFYRKRALEVKTRQILNLILPEYSKLRRSSEAGGGSFSDVGQNINPFKRKGEKPAAYWSGVIDIGPNLKKLSYKVPDYFSGNLKVFVVSITKNRMGHSEASSLVRGDFTISPNAPLFLTPGDKTTLAVGLANHVENSGENAVIDLSIESSSNIKVKENAVKTISVAEGSEGKFEVQLEALDQLGEASFTILASKGSAKTKRTIQLGIRPSVPFYSQFRSGVIQAGGSKDLPINFTPYEKFGKNEFSVASGPLALLPGVYNYLGSYPYMCTEQLTSKLLANLYQTDFGFKKLSRAEVQERLGNFVKVLISRQMPSGGLVPWPGAHSEAPFHSAFAYHLLIEANDRGYKVPARVLENLNRYLKKYSVRSITSFAMARVQAYSAYLLARDETVSTNALTAIGKWLKQNEDKSWKKDITIMYMAAAYKIMQADVKANEYLNMFDFKSTPLADYEIGVYNSLIKRSLFIYIISKHFPKRLKTIDKEFFENLLPKDHGLYNTYALALLGLAATTFNQNQNGVKGMVGFQAMVKTPSGTTPLNLLGKEFLKSSFPLNSSRIKMENSSKNLAFYSISQEGFERKNIKEISSKDIEVFREIKSLSDEPVTELKIGEEYLIHLRYRSLKVDYINHMSVVDLIPSGVQILVDSVRTPGARESTSSIDDIDEESFEEERSAGYNYIDVRDDRLVLFTNFTKAVQTYTYRVKAIAKGDFNVAPIFAESMYDLSIKSQGKPGKIKIQ